MLFNLDLVAMLSDSVDSQCISCVTGLITKRALMTEPTNVGFHMLFHSVSELGAIVTLSTLPDCFPHRAVIGGYHELIALSLQLIFIADIILTLGRLINHSRGLGVGLSQLRSKLLLLLRGEEA